MIYSEMEIGTVIRALRRERGLSQAEVARAAGTSQPAIARLEAGRSSPSIATIERILAAMGLRLELTTAEVDTGVDRTLIAQMLRLTPVERLAALEQQAASIVRMRRAMGSGAA